MDIWDEMESSAYRLIREAQKAAEILAEMGKFESAGRLKAAEEDLREVFGEDVGGSQNG
tara:strand:+ start:643 stop:819 length:177 start_codon:yes stop_codon:yes gene_type:complete